jgi:hypothetical protein
MRALRTSCGTRIGLQPVADGRAAAIDHYAIAVAPFDRGALAARPGERGAKILPSDDEPDVLRFLDDNGITVEVRVVK